MLHFTIQPGAVTVHFAHFCWHASCHPMVEL